MCGTSKKFTIDYKTDKKDRYKRKLEKAAKKKSENKVSYFGIPVINLAPSAEDSQENLDASHLSITSIGKRGSMSAIERLEALNYRRLNTLSLRQKVSSPRCQSHHAEFYSPLKSAYEPHIRSSSLSHIFAVTFVHSTITSGRAAAADVAAGR